MKYVVPFLLILLGNACIPTTVGETTSAKISSSAPKRWSSSAFPRPLQISEDFSNNEVTAINAMVDAWESSISNSRNLMTVSTTPAIEVDDPNIDLEGLGKDGVNGIYRITRWPSSIPGTALAVTQLFMQAYNPGTANEYYMLLHGDILINYSYSFRTVSDTSSSSNYDLLTVVLHELGHYLGLGHRTGDSVMIEAIGRRTEIRAPRPLDVTALTNLYGITLPALAGSSMAVKPRSPVTEYIPAENEPFVPVKLIIELHTNGECVHKKDGVVIERHPASIKF